MGDYAQAVELTRRDDTCVHAVTSKQHITLNPKFIGQMAKGVREVLNGQLNLYSDRYVHYIIKNKSYLSLPFVLIMFLYKLSSSQAFSDFNNLKKIL